MSDTERIDQLEMAVGMPRATSPRLSQKDWEALKPWPTTVSGDYNLWDWLRLNSQIAADQRKMIDAQAEQIAFQAQQIDGLQRQVAAITPAASRPPSQVSIPPELVVTANYPLGAYKRPMRPLTNGEQRNAIDALVRGGRMDIAEPLELGFTKGFYPVVDPSVVTPIQVVRWADGTPQADKDALDILLSAIDQRVPNTDGTFTPNLLPVGDPRIVPISGTLVTSSGTGTPVNTPIVFADSVVMVNPETGFTNYVSTSQNDDGLRVMYNYRFPWANGAPSNPKLPQLTIFAERDGGISMNGLAPQTDANGNPVPKGPYDALRGKDLVIYPNGFARDGQGKAKSVDIACMQAGRTLRLGASSETAKPTFPIEITPDGASVNGRPL